MIIMHRIILIHFMIRAEGHQILQLSIDDRTSLFYSIWTLLANELDDPTYCFARTQLVYEDK